MLVRQFSRRSYRAIFKWGDPKVFYEVKPAIRRFVTERLGVDAERLPGPVHPGLQEVSDLAGPRLPEGVCERLERIVGQDNVSTDVHDRLRFWTGATAVDALRLRLGRVQGTADAVVHPRSEQEIVEILALCQEQGLAVVPTGGRTTVTGALDPGRSGIALDLTRHLNRVLGISEADLTARVQPGILGPEYEEHLERRGFTCGHFPQSFEFATPGGWVAAKGAGQQSTYYGKAEDFLVALRCATPRGLLATRDFPRASIGPDLAGMIAGSEGSFGVITELTLRIWPRHPQVPFCFMFHCFDDGADFLRTLIQAGVGHPGVSRLSDGEETDAAFQLDGLAGTGADRWLRRLGYVPGQRALFIGASEGDRLTGAALAARAHALALRRGGLPLGSAPLRKWAKRRFHDPYLRDDLMDMGVVVDTLETAVPWSGLARLRRGVRAAIKSRPRTAALAHISHAYEHGANLYFIFMSPLAVGDELDDFQRYHGQIVDAIVEHGGSLSHHHGIGRLFASRLPAQIGEVGHGMIGALKRYLDPERIMNPGALGL